MLPEFSPSDPRLGTVSSPEGYLVEPGRVGVELLVGLRVTTDGLEHRAGLRVVYSVDDTTYKLDYAAAIAACPHGNTIDRCREVVGVQEHP